MAVDSKFLQGSLEGRDVMLAKHMHPRLEGANEDEAGLCVRQVGDVGVEVEGALDIGVDVACLERSARAARKWYAPLPSVHRCARISMRASYVAGFP